MKARPVLEDEVVVSPPSISEPTLNRRARRARAAQERRETKKLARAIEDHNRRRLQRNRAAALAQGSEMK